MNDPESSEKVFLPATGLVRVGKSSGFYDNESKGEPWVPDRGMWSEFEVAADINTLPAGSVPVSFLNDTLLMRPEYLEQRPVLGLLSGFALEATKVCLQYTQTPTYLHSDLGEKIGLPPPLHGVSAYVKGLEVPIMAKYKLRTKRRCPNINVCVANRDPEIRKLGGVLVEHFGLSVAALRSGDAFWATVSYDPQEPAEILYFRAI